MSLLHDDINASRYAVAQSVMGPESPNDHKGSELCIITLAVFILEDVLNVWTNYKRLGLSATNINTR